jgi:hypothetical protein
VARHARGPGGAVPQRIHTELARKVTAQALKFVACMRAHGLPTFPDPHVSSSGIEMQLPKGLQPNSPVFRAAQQACKRLMPGLP